MVLLLVFAGVLGLAIGSFLNVVVHRVPAGQSVVSPPSRCPRCEQPIRARHNLPVLGWLLLRGRCADCGTPISPRYPLVELLTGALFTLLALRLAQLDQLPALPAVLAFTALGVALAFIDLDTRRLPNALVLPAYPVLAALLTGAAAVSGSWDALLRGALGAAALFVAFLSMAVIHPAGMGLGDVKLAGVVGLLLGWFSWAAVVVGAFAAFFLGAVVGVAVMAVGPHGRKTAVPFGPFMIAGALLALWIADPAMALVLRT